MAEHKFDDEGGAKSAPKLDTRMIDRLCQLYATAQPIVINTEAMTKVTASLEDEDGEEACMQEIVRNVQEYIEESLKDHDSTLATQIQPFLFSSITTFILESFPKETALFLLTNDLAKHVCASAVLHGFLMGKVLTNNNLQIVSTVEEISENELELMQKNGEVQDLATKAVLSGDMEESLNEILRQKAEEFDSSDENEGDDEDEQ